MSRIPGTVKHYLKYNAMYQVCVPKLFHIHGTKVKIVAKIKMVHIHGT